MLYRRHRPPERRGNRREFAQEQVSPKQRPRSKAISSPLKEMKKKEKERNKNNGSRNFTLFATTQEGGKKTPFWV